MHSGCIGFITLINMGENDPKYAFNDQTKFYPLPKGEKENVELGRKNKIRLYTDNAVFIIKETSKFRLPSCGETYVYL